MEEHEPTRRELLEEDLKRLHDQHSAEQVKEPWNQDVVRMSKIRDEIAKINIELDKLPDGEVELRVEDTPEPDQDLER